MMTPTHDAWARLRRWLKDGIKEEARQIDRENNPWRRGERQERLNTFGAVLIVMESEMRCAVRRKRTKGRTT